MSTDGTLERGINEREVLKDLTCAQFQSLSGSGILTDVLEAAKTIEDLNERRAAVRVALGLAHRGIGTWNLPKSKSRREFPTWMVIKLGTHKSMKDLSNTLTDGGCMISDHATYILKQV